MTRKQYARAIRLADKLVEQTANPDLRQTALDLRAMLTPPPSMQEILALVPGESIIARSKVLGISRQTYYNLAEGLTRASLPIAEKIASVTGVNVEIVKDVFW